LGTVYICPEGRARSDATRRRVEITNIIVGDRPQRRAVGHRHYIKARRICDGKGDIVISCINIAGANNRNAELAISLVHEVVVLFDAGLGGASLDTVAVGDDYVLDPNLKIGAVVAETHISRIADHGAQAIHPIVECGISYVSPTGEVLTSG